MRGEVRRGEGRRGEERGEERGRGGLGGEVRKTDIMISGATESGQKKMLKTMKFF